MRRVINYRQIEWLPPNEDVVALLTGVLAGRPLVQDTLFEAHGERCEVRHREISDDELRLHLVTHIQGGRKGIRSNAINVPVADVAEAGPPAGADFIERQIALVVRQSCLGYVATAHTMASQVERLLRSLVAFMIKI